MTVDGRTSQLILKPSACESDIQALGAVRTQVRWSSFHTPPQQTLHDRVSFHPLSSLRGAITRGGQQHPNAWDWLWVKLCPPSRWEPALVA